MNNPPPPRLTELRPTELPIWQQLWAQLRSWLWYGVLPAWLVVTFVGHLAWVQGDSMEPTLHTGDVVLLLKYPHWLQKLGLAAQHTGYQTGQIVIFRAPAHSPYAYEQGWFGRMRSYNIKRIVGQAGDTLMLKDGELFRAGQRVQESYISTGYMNDMLAFEVPAHTIWVLGDNRQQGSSIDSRMYGPVQLSDVSGPVVWRIWPRWGKL